MHHFNFLQERYLYQTCIPSFDMSYVADILYKQDAQVILLFKLETSASLNVLRWCSYCEMTWLPRTKLWAIRLQHIYVKSNCRTLCPPKCHSNAKSCSFLIFKELMLSIWNLTGWAGSFLYELRGCAAALHSFVWRLTRARNNVDAEWQMNQKIAQAVSSLWREDQKPFWPRVTAFSDVYLKRLLSDLHASFFFSLFSQQTQY